MADLALHLSPAGLSYVLVPESFDETCEHLISVEFRSWPSWELGQPVAARAVRTVIGL